MGRKCKPLRLTAIYTLICQSPGLRPGQVATRLELRRYQVMRALPDLDARRMLLYEDDRGCLYPFYRG